MPSKPDLDPQLRESEEDNGGCHCPRGAVVACPEQRGSAHTAHMSSGRPLLPETDDEALARILQEQFLEEDRTLQNTERQSEVVDLQIARMMQNEENARRAMRDIHSIRGSVDGQDFLSRMQREALVEAQSRLSALSSLRSEATAAERSLEDNDRELARCMQQLEEMGMGRLNSNRGSFPYSDSSARGEQAAIAESDPPSFLSPQEEDGARLSSRIAGGGDETQALGSALTQSSSTVQTKSLTRSVDRSGHRSESNDGTSPKVDRRAGLKSASGTSGPSEPPGILSNPPGIDLARPGIPVQVPDTKKRKMRGILNSILGKGSLDRGYERSNPSPRLSQPRANTPSSTPPAPTRIPGPLPFSVSVSTQVKVPVEPNAQLPKKKSTSSASRSPVSSSCCGCGKAANSFLIAIDKKYHQECFKCIGCHLVIDSSGPFAYMTDEGGERHPLHRKCYSELYGVRCAVCRRSIPAGPDGKVSFVKHPFFGTEQMCPSHASNPGRRCTGCHRFEPEGQPFADLGDSNRCVCFSCCRTVVVDGNDAKPLWKNVIDFFENTLKLPIWKDMREVPVLIVGFDALNDQLMTSGGVHGGSSQIMTRGLCLTEHQSGRKFKLPRLKFDKQNQSFEACDVEEKGFTFFQVPDANKVNPDASVTAILCLSGLPGDLAASVLAHEATHAWIKLHPAFKIGYPIPPMVEEGVAQLVAMLFLTDGLEPASTETYGDRGPSDEKLRQYFKFSIETDDHEIYGEGYRRAAKAYADIGIEALLSHVVLYKDFPMT